MEAGERSFEAALQNAWFEVLKKGLAGDVGNSEPEAR